jgi:hypothetical protein
MWQDLARCGESSAATGQRPCAGNLARQSAARRNQGRTPPALFLLSPRAGMGVTPCMGWQHKPWAHPAGHPDHRSPPRRPVRILVGAQPIAAEVFSRFPSRQASPTWATVRRWRRASTALSIGILGVRRRCASGAPARDDRPAITMRPQASSRSACRAWPDRCGQLRGPRCPRCWHGALAPIALRGWRSPRPVL